MPVTTKVKFNFDIESTDKMHSVTNNIGRAIVKKKMLLLGLKEIDMINNSDIYDIYEDL